MTRNFRNSIMIPLTHKKAFMRKFTTKRRIVHFLAHFMGPHRYLAEPLEFCVNFNRILRMPNSSKMLQTEWFEQNWGTLYNASCSDFANHDDKCCEHSGMFEITFSTIGSEAGKKIVEQIARRLHCDVEHVFLSEDGEIHGIREFKFDDGECHDEPELFFMQEANDTLETYETIVARFFGWSEYADELVEKYKGKVIGAAYHRDEDEE